MKYVQVSWTMLSTTASIEEDTHLSCSKSLYKVFEVCQLEWVSPGDRGSLFLTTPHVIGQRTIEHHLRFVS